MISPKIAIFIFTIIVPSTICFGSVYRIGDASGWHPMLNYTKWSSSKNFQIGDTIRFEYNAIFHNVKEVTESNYKTCNGTKAIGTYFTGNDSFTLDHTGHRYFICGFINHCKYGQKVDIYVAGETPGPSPVPANSEPLSPPSPAVHENPADSSSSISHHILSVQYFATKYLVMVIVVLCYFV